MSPFVDPETGKPVSLLHKWFFHSKTFWLNVVGLAVEVLTAQQVIALPFLAPLRTVEGQQYLAFVVFTLNMVLRALGGAPLRLMR